MEIKELRSFCMVAKLGSISRASEALGVGQPAVTKHIRRLEAEIGRKLFLRDTRPFQLTATGSNLFRMAEPLVEGLVGLSDRAPLSASPPVTIAVPHGFIGYVLPEAVRELREVHPLARVRIRSGTKEEAFELVQSGSVDFAVAPDMAGSRRFDFMPLFPSERILITPKDHLFTSQPPRSLKDVARYPLILPRFQTQTRALLESEFRRLGVAYDIAVELDSMDLLERYVELGVGLAVGLRGAAMTEAIIPLGIVSLDRFLPSELVGIVRNRARPLSEYAETLIGLLEAAGTVPSNITRMHRK